MRILLLLLAALLITCSSCRLLRPTPAEKLADLVAAHPELARTDTIHDTVRVYVPQVEIRRVFVPVPDTVREQLERHTLDSLLSQLDVSLDSVQHVAARSRVLQWMLRRPVLHDTLCFDTLGVMGRVWRVGHTYQLWIVRKALTQDVPTQHVVTRLLPCPPAPVYAWYDPKGWAWWLLLGAGFLGGVAVCYGLFRLAIYSAR